MYKRMIALFIAAVIFFAVFTACAGETGDILSENSFTVYYPLRQGSSDVDKIITDIVCEYPEGEDTGALIDRAMDKLLHPPEGGEAVSPIVETGFGYSYALESGILTLDIAGDYGELSGMALTIADVCITLTLCSIDGVESVLILSEGEAHPNKNRAGALRVGDVVLRDLELQPLEQAATLYFPDEDGKYLEPERLIFVLRENRQIERYVAEELIKTADGSGGVIPEGTKLLSISVDNGVCYVNLSREFSDGAAESFAAQRLAVLSITNSLASLPKIDSVRILVDGMMEDYYGGVYIGRPMTFEQESVRSFSAYDNSTDVELYYPVTGTGLMAPVYRRLNTWQGQDRVKETVDLLFSISAPSWAAISPVNGIQSKNIRITDSIVEIDLPKTFYDEAKKNAGYITAIAATLFGMDNINEVIFLMDGESPGEIRGMDLDKPVRREDMGFVR